MMTDTRHWYEQPWVWLLIALPASAVFGGIATIYLAVTTDDGLVVDDYYKQGKEINRTLERDRYAAILGLEGKVEMRGGRVYVTLQSRYDAPLPDSIQVSFLHSTRAGEDQIVTAERLPTGHYAADISDISLGKWHVQVSTDKWRMTSVMHYPTETPVTLESQVAP